MPQPTLPPRLVVAIVPVAGIGASLALAATAAAAAAAAAAKLDPPDAHKPIDTHVDNVIHHADGYMSPPNTSDNKRDRKDVTSSHADVVPPDE